MQTHPKCHETTERDKLVQSNALTNASIVYIDPPLNGRAQRREHKSLVIDINCSQNTSVHL